jgi:hypothetical protein
LQFILIRATNRGKIQFNHIDWFNKAVIFAATAPNLYQVVIVLAEIGVGLC